MFSYFSQFDPLILNKTVIDWGCGHSNFLHFCPDFPRKNYIGVDVNKHLINWCKKKWPDTCFKHFQHFNWQYSHHEKLTSWPNLKKKCDLILAFSVFTHTDYSDLVSCLSYFKSILKEKGKIYFTFYSNSNRSAFELVRLYRKEHNYRRDYWQKIKNSHISYMYSVNGLANLMLNKESLPKIPCDSFFALYDESWLAKRVNGNKLQSPTKSDNLLFNNQICIEIS